MSKAKLNWIKSNFPNSTVELGSPAKKRKLNALLNDTVVIVDDFESNPLTIVKPKKVGDLAVNKKKIDEVSLWLKNPKDGSILLLNGPPGCGKLTTLKVLCASLNVNLVEWVTPAKYYDPENPSLYQSDKSRFEEFVTRATRYSNVLTSQSSRLVAVKDIPNGFLRDSSTFHEFLDKYASIPELRLAFITTDVNITRDLFSERIKLKHNIKTISFNPCTQKSVKDVLQKLAKGKYSDYIEGISLSCHGDLRNAIATLQFLSIKDELPKKKSKVKKSKNVTVAAQSVDLFHGLGRVLYSKRESDGKLSHSPVEVGESFVSSPEFFVGMLQQNYLNTFSSVHDLAKASSKLSLSNAILSDFKDTLTSRSLGLVLASHALMSFNSKPIRRFQHFDKPKKSDDIVSDFAVGLFKTKHELSDIVSYGSRLPNFTSNNQELLSKYSLFKSQFPRR